MSAETPTVDQDEPQTPTWFTLLGVALFLFAGIFALVLGELDTEEPATNPEAQAPSENAAAPQAANAEPGAAPRPTAPPQAAPVDPHAGHGH